MNIAHLFELCLLDNSGQVKEDLGSLHYHEYFLLYRTKLTKQQTTASSSISTDTLFSRKTLILPDIITSMKNALESDFTYRKKNIYWFNRFDDDISLKEAVVSSSEEEEDTVIKEINIIFISLPPESSFPNDINIDETAQAQILIHTYIMMVYLSKTNECYVINHVPINDSEIEKVLGFKPRIVHRTFRKDNTSLVMNIELDTLRVIMAIYLDQYEKYLGTGNNESIDFVKGIIEVDPDLKEKFDNHKKLIHLLDENLTLPTTIPFILELNNHICHYLVQVHQLWLKYNNLPLMMLFDGENRRHFCQLNSNQALSSIVPSEMITTPLFSMLMNETETIKYKVKQKKKTIIPKSQNKTLTLPSLKEKTMIIDPIMNDDYVERSKEETRVIKRDDTPQNVNLPKTFDIRGKYEFANSWIWYNIINSWNDSWKKNREKRRNNEEEEEEEEESDNEEDDVCYLKGKSNDDNIETYSYDSFTSDDEY